MKSFFKKLAFVMALAMVVSMVAPAGSVFAAETGIAVQGTKTIVEAYEFEKVGATFDFCFLGAPADWKTTFNWETSNPAVATVDKAGVVTAVAPGTATITITAGADKSYVETVKITVKEEVEQITAKQITAKTVKVAFTANHDFDATGADSDATNTVKVYRVFSTEEMAKMANKNGLKFDEAGNGYQAYYVMDVIPTWNEDETQDYTTWTIAGYDWFVDGAKYAVVYGPNETSSTIDGIMATFTAYVGKVAYIDLTADQATVENDVEPAIPATITCKLFNAQHIDLTDYYKNADETDYELLTEDLDVSVSGNEVTFDETGAALIKGSYTFYDEDLEEDVVLTDEVVVLGGNYSTYRVDSIYNWTLKTGYGSDGWATTSTSMIAGDTDELYVIVTDNRGRYYSNVPGIENWNNGKGYWINDVQVKEIGDGIENTPFEQYGYELVFDSLDPDSLLVDPDGFVTSYKKTNSFAVVSYKRSDDEAAKLHEIGVMGITVTAARKLDDVYYKNGTSFTVLKETESEDGHENANYYEGYDDFNLEDELKVVFLNQYGKAWDSSAEDWGEVETEFTVTTSKDDFEGVAEAIADALNEDGTYTITAAIFAGTNTTSVTFKIKERATGDSTNVTIKLDKPKYEVDANGDETDVVYVDPNKAIVNVADKELYLSVGTDAKLFQVSKASQKVGYVRVGTLENDDDEDRNYYLANEVIKTSFTVNDDKPLASYVTTASAAPLNGLKENDYILVVTDPSGKVVPAVGKGGAGKAVDAESGIGLVASEDGTHFDFILAAMSNETNSVLEYATAGTYRATVYKVSNVTTSEGNTKYTLSRVTSDSFEIKKTLKEASFYHQEETKDVEIGTFTDKDDIFAAIAATMTFKLAGKAFNVALDDNGKFTGTYKSYEKFYKNGVLDYYYLGIELIDAEYKIQAGGKRAVISTATFRIQTPAGLYYDTKVKVNRSVNATEE